MILYFARSFSSISWVSSLFPTTKRFTLFRSIFLDLKKLYIMNRLLQPIKVKMDITVDMRITPLEKAYSLKKYVMDEFTKKPVRIALNAFTGDRRFCEL